MWDSLQTDPTLTAQTINVIIGPLHFRCIFSRPPTWSLQLYPTLSLGNVTISCSKLLLFITIRTKLLCIYQPTMLSYCFVCWLFILFYFLTLLYLYSRVCVSVCVMYKNLKYTEEKQRPPVNHGAVINTITNKKIHIQVTFLTQKLERCLVEKKTHYSEFSS